MNRINHTLMTLTVVLSLSACQCTDRSTCSNTFTCKQALNFLYEYMPQSDRADYDTAFFRQQVEYAFRARETFAWGHTVPDELFRHFVLVYRVNNEDLDTARAYIFHQLRNRIRHMSMYDAALEVNHWCHEHVSYEPSDGRTSAPLATLRTGHGRCGEESTLTVTALRAVCIPARQCYVPRWAHCDDNHAWVEAWIDGEWYYMGACEPAPKLNMGWFTIPSSRAMMVHTNVFGHYNGPEVVNHQTRFYSCINVLDKYADTVRITVTVTDSIGHPMPNVDVDFKLYNYAEYYTLATKRTDSLGHASLITGKGDLLVWVRQANRYNYAKIDGRTQRTITIPLNNAHYGRNYVETFDMIAPIGGATLPAATPEQIAECNRRIRHEDTLRLAYRATFPTRATLSGIHNANFDDNALFDIINKSEGNHTEILKFLQWHTEPQPSLLLPEFVAALSDKDLRDTRAEVLEAQLTHYKAAGYPRDVYIKGILPARISNELLRPWRTELMTALHTYFKHSPTLQEIIEFTRHEIHVDADCNYYNCPISPMGVWRTRLSDAHSRDIFFVAACRSANIPAFMDNTNGALYAWNDHHWQHITLEHDTAQRAESTGYIVLHNPNHYEYYRQYTLERFTNGTFTSYDFEDDARMAANPIRLQVPAGYYLLSTGNRYSDGQVRSRLEFFTVTTGQTVERTIRLMPLEVREGNYGNIDLRSTHLADTTLADIIAATGQQKMIICLVDDGEPSNHLLKELAQQRVAFQKWGGRVLLLNDTPSNCLQTRNNFNEIVAAVNTVTTEAVKSGQLKTFHGIRPICLVCDQNGTISFLSEGYHIGSAALMLAEVKK